MPNSLCAKLPIRFLNGYQKMLYYAIGGNNSIRNEE